MFWGRPYGKRGHRLEGYSWLWILLSSFSVSLSIFIYLSFNLFLFQHPKGQKNMLLIVTLLFPLSSLSISLSVICLSIYSLILTLKPTKMMLLIDSPPFFLFLIYQSVCYLCLSLSFLFQHPKLNYLPLSIYLFVSFSYSITITIMPFNFIFSFQPQNDKKYATDRFTSLSPLSIYLYLSIFQSFLISSPNTAKWCCR